MAVFHNQGKSISSPHSAGAYTGPVSVGRFVAPIAGKTLSRGGTVLAELMSEWASIAGPSLAGLHKPGKADEVRADPSSAGKAAPSVLHLKVDPVKALEVQYCTPQLIERINQTLGFRAVSGLRVVQAPLFNKPARQPRAGEARARERRAAQARKSPERGPGADGPGRKSPWMFGLRRLPPRCADLKFGFSRSKTTRSGSSQERPVDRNRRIAVFAPGAMALIALLAFNPFSVTGNGIGFEAAIAAEDQAAPAKEAAPALAESALPDMVLGKEDAPVTIVEYSSLTCPHCAHFHRDVMPELKSEYIDAGKVRYIQREFPLNNAALAGSVLARCIDPSRFFAFTDLLFSKQEDWAFKDDAMKPLRLYAKQAGLNDADFDKCIDNEELQKKVLAVRERGEKEGVKGTPTFFINGKIFNGVPTLAAMVEAMKPYLSTQ